MSVPRQRGDNRGPMRPLVILISGHGSNMEALARTAQREAWRERLGAHVACVISNRPDAPGLATAQQLGLPTEVLDHRGFASREAFDQALMQRIDAHAPALVLLAGFMRILTPGLVRHYAGRMVNIHPSLLPAFAGLHTHRRAIAAGCRVAGATVHWVAEQVDGVESAEDAQGAAQRAGILGQAVVPVLPGDDEHSLGARVLAEEHLLYPRVVRELLSRTR